MRPAVPRLIFRHGTLWGSSSYGWWGRAGRSGASATPVAVMEPLFHWAAYLTTYGLFPQRWLLEERPLQHRQELSDLLSKCLCGLENGFSMASNFHFAPDLLNFALGID
jgi:hypothetical protein